MSLTITFKKSGTNSENAVTGSVTLRDGSTVVLQANAFSGGNGFNPLDDGSYRLHLDIRGDESTDQANTDGTLKPYYGIQKVSNDVVDDNGTHWDMQVEWGTIRARLNPTSGTDHGDYLHGKHRPRDYTHGCICDRSEVILNYLWNLANPPSVIPVDVTSAGNFYDETLVKKNMGQKLAEGPYRSSDSKKH